MTMNENRNPNKILQGTKSMETHIAEDARSTG